MANETTSTVLTTQILTELILPQVGEAIREGSVMMPLMKVQSLEGIPTKTASWQFFGAVTTSTITEGTALSNATTTMSEATSAVGQKGSKMLLMDLAVESTVMDTPSIVARDLSAGMLDAFESDACALLDDFTNTAGGTGANCSHTYLIDAIYTLKLNAKGLADDRAAFVLHPRQVADVQIEAAGALSNANPGNARLVNTLLGDTANSKVLSSYVGDFMGIPVFSSGHVALNNSDADRGGALFVVGEALGAAVKYMPRIEMQRDINNGQPGTAVLGHFSYGVVELRDSLGVSIITDA
jgi:hypothetical protein